MKRFRLYAAVLSLGLSSVALGFTAGATSAAASTIRNGTANGSAAAVCPIVSSKFTIYASGCSQPWSHACSGSGFMPYAPEFVSNGCSTRAWIYLAAVRAGYNLCINPDQGVGPLARTYTYFYISSNTSPC